MSAELLIRLPDYFPSLINAMQDGFVLRGTDGTVIEVNDAFCDMVGLDRKQIIGSRPPHLWWPENAHAAFERAFNRYISGVTAEDELAYQRSDGSTFPALVTNAPLRDSEDRIIAYIGTIKDLSERVKTEEQIRFQAALIDQVQAGVIATDANGTIVFWNRGAEAVYGWQASDVVGQFGQEIVLGPEADNVVAKMVDALRVGAPWEGELQVQRRDGTPFPALISASAVHDAAGTPAGIVGVVVDITERKRAELAVQESEARFRTMANSAPILLWVSDPDGLCTWFNTGWLEFTGRTMEQEIGNGWAEGVHPDDLEECLATFQTSLQTRQPFEMEYRLRHHDGEYCWVVDRGAPRIDPDGTFVGFVGSCIDISERKRNEEEQAFLAEATRILASSLDYQETLASVAQLAVPTIADWCVVHTVDTSGTIEPIAVAHVDPDKVAWARELQERYPSNPDATYGVPNVVRTGEPEIYPEVTDELLMAAARDDEHLALLRNVGFTSAMALPVIARDRVLGVITLVSAELGRRYDDHDQGLAQHLADRAAVAIDNALLYREAREAARARDQFLAVAAHELRSPLTSMKGFAQLLMRRANRLPSGSEWIAPLETIDSQVNRMTQLVSRLLDVSRIEEQRLQLQVEPVDMVEVVRSAAVEAQLATDQHTVAARFAEESMIAVIDRTRIEQVLANLLDNATRYSPAGTSIEVVLTGDDDTLVVSVHDQGPGIPVEAQERMFERYFRGTASTRAAAEGLGLGLYVAHGIVDAHGGRMWVESAVGKGSTFSFSVPRNHHASADAGEPLTQAASG